MYDTACVTGWMRAEAARAWEAWLLISRYTPGTCRRPERPYKQIAPH